MEMLKTKLLEYSKKKAIASDTVYIVDLYAIDSEFYRQYKAYYGEYPIAKEIRISNTKDFKSNINKFKRKTIMKVAVYYCGGKFRELITDTPICAIKEYADIDPSTGKTIVIPDFQGEPEALFFVYSNANNAFDFGCERLRRQALQTISKDDLENYYSSHENAEYYRLELEAEKSKALNEYRDILLGITAEDLDIEGSYAEKRKRIEVTSRKTQQM